MSPTLSTATLCTHEMSTVIHSLLGWGYSELERNTFGGSSWMSRCWRKTGWDGGKIGDGSSHSRLGCFSGTDRIGYFTNFAAPINCCWFGHTHHWCIQATLTVHFNWLKDSKECELVSPSKFLCCASAPKLKNWEGEDLGLIIDLVLLNMELSGNLNPIGIRLSLLVDWQWLFSKHFHSLPWQNQVVQAPNPWLLVEVLLLGLPPKQTLDKFWRFPCSGQYWMEVVEGLNMVFFLSTSPMVMEE